MADCLSSIFIKDGFFRNKSSLCWDAASVRDGLGKTVWAGRSSMPLLLVESSTRWVGGSQAHKLSFTRCLGKSLFPCRRNCMNYIKIRAKVIKLHTQGFSTNHFRLAWQSGWAKTVPRPPHAPGGEQRNKPAVFCCTWLIVETSLSPPLPLIKVSLQISDRTKIGVQIHEMNDLVLFFFCFRKIRGQRGYQTYQKWSYR